MASALYLILTLFAVAALFVLRQAHFLAAIQVIVYAGRWWCCSSSSSC